MVGADYPGPAVSEGKFRLRIDIIGARDASAMLAFVFFGNGVVVIRPILTGFERRSINQQASHAVGASVTVTSNPR